MPLNRVLLLVTATDRAQVTQVVEPLRVGAERAVKALHAEGAESRLLLAIAAPKTDDDDYGRILQNGLSNGVKLGGFDAVVELTIPGRRRLADLVGCLEEIRGTAGDAIDSPRSAAVAGTDVVLVDGVGPLRLFYAMRRKAGTSHADFCRYWEKRHSKMTRITPGLAGFKHLHADLDASKRAAEAAGVGLHDIDGVSLQWYRSAHDFAKVVALVGPMVPHADAPMSFKDKALSSEREFSDLNRATAIVATQVRARLRVASS